LKYQFDAPVGFTPAGHIRSGACWRDERIAVTLDGLFRHPGVHMRAIVIFLASALALASGPAFAVDATTQDANKKTVLEFYEKGLNQKDFDAAAKFIGPRYVQHNPTAPDGPEGFRTFLGFLREKFPDSHSDIKRVFADGDYVILHVHSVREKGSRGRAIVDIFRLEDGKIVEHWDVVQDVPEKSANTNGMF
jgi:predicted SnoaL-like aldol condensation-catalyzing enzyme